jgi:hypothetical protein
MSIKISNKSCEVAFNWKNPDTSEILSSTLHHSVVSNKYRHAIYEKEGILYLIRGRNYRVIFADATEIPYLKLGKHTIPTQLGNMFKIPTEAKTGTKQCFQITLNEQQYFSKQFTLMSQMPKRKSPPGQKKRKSSIPLEKSGDNKPAKRQKHAVTSQTNRPEPKIP